MKFGSTELSTLTLLSLLNSSAYIAAFTPSFGISSSSRTSSDVFSFSAAQRIKISHMRMSDIDSFNFNEDPNEDVEEEEDDDDDDEEEKSLYEEFASSEFTTDTPSTSSSEMTLGKPKEMDWGGEYDTLRSRAEDAKNGRVGPSRALFRAMTDESPNEAIMNFVSGASPEVVSAMSSAVSSLLGGLFNPGAGMQTTVKANGEKLGSLCFQLQMTGYMFRNAEYVLAIRDLMNIRGSAGLDDYKRAFDKLDKDGSGFIESGEVEELLSDVYEGELPAFEVETFLQFFDSNNDGRISWEEFEKGLGVVAEKQKTNSKRGRSDLALVGTVDDDEEDDEDDYIDADLGEPTVSGMIQIEMQNGKVVEVEAAEYIKELKREAEALKSALSREKRGPGAAAALPGPGAGPQPPNPMNMGRESGDSGGIASYIASLQGDIKSLTEGISPDVVDAMKMLVDFVLDGNSGNQGRDKPPVNELEMEIPGSALQHLALWQLVLGYKLREAEATGDYKKMLE